MHKKCRKHSFSFALRASLGKNGDCTVVFVLSIQQFVAQAPEKNGAFSDEDPSKPATQSREL